MLLLSNAITGLLKMSDYNNNCAEPRLQYCVIPSQTVQNDANK